VSEKWILLTNIFMLSCRFDITDIFYLVWIPFISIVNIYSGTYT